MIRRIYEIKDSSHTIFYRETVRKEIVFLGVEEAKAKLTILIPSLKRSEIKSLFSNIFYLYRNRSSIIYS